MQMLVTADRFVLDFNHTFVVRDQVQQSCRGFTEEVQIRKMSTSDITGCLLEKCPLSVASWLATSGTKSIATHRQLFARLSFSHRPRIEQQRGAVQHIARKLVGILSIDDVSVFVADVASREID